MRPLLFILAVTACGSLERSPDPTECDDNYECAGPYECVFIGPLDGGVFECRGYCDVYEQCPPDEYCSPIWPVGSVCLPREQQ